MSTMDTSFSVNPSCSDFMQPHYGLTDMGGPDEPWLHTLLGDSSNSAPSPPYDLMAYTTQHLGLAAYIDQQGGKPSPVDDPRTVPRADHVSSVNERTWQLWPFEAPYQQLSPPETPGSSAAQQQLLCANITASTTPTERSFSRYACKEMTISSKSMAHRLDDEVASPAFSAADYSFSNEFTPPLNWGTTITPPVSLSADHTDFEWITPVETPWLELGGSSPEKTPEICEEKDHEQIRQHESEERKRTPEVTSGSCAFLVASRKPLRPKKRRILSSSRSVMERNRVAANNSRLRKRKKEVELATEMNDLEDTNRDLHQTFKDLTEEVWNLKMQVLQHAHCRSELIRRYIEQHAHNHVQML